MQLHHLHEMPTGKQMSGLALARRVKKSSPAVRAALAARIARGQISIAALTRAQTALLTGLHVSSVSLAKGASDEDLTALRRGMMSLRALRAKRRGAPGKDTVENFIAHVGVEAAMGVFEQMAKSVIAAAAE